MMSDNFEFCMHVCEAGWYHGDIFLAEVSFLIALFATLDINLVKSRFYPNSIPQAQVQLEWRDRLLPRVLRLFAQEKLVDHQQRKPKGIWTQV
jgi:hypothetical protein